LWNGVPLTWCLLYSATFTCLLVIWHGNIFLIRCWIHYLLPWLNNKTFCSFFVVIPFFSIW
jgi:hypothetical protein